MQDRTKTFVRLIRSSVVWRAAEPDAPSDGEAVPDRRLRRRFWRVGLRLNGRYVDLRSALDCARYLKVAELRRPHRDPAAISPTPRGTPGRPRTVRPAVACSGRPTVPRRGSVRLAT